MANQIATCPKCKKVIELLNIRPQDDRAQVTCPDCFQTFTEKVNVPKVVEPIPMILHCPDCGGRHVDAGEFATKPHHTHACQHCGLVWRPAIVPTVGVQFLPGFKDEPVEWGELPELAQRIVSGVASGHSTWFGPDGRSWQVKTGDKIPTRFP